MLAVGVALGAAIAFAAGGGDPAPQGGAAPRTAAVVDPKGKPERVPRRPHVVLLIMDEFPADALLGRGGRIDAVRYPNFAALAGNAHWFPNAYASYDSTPKAIPLILDGLRPILHNPPTRRGHPRSIYDMFGRRGYRIVNSEESTALCPRRLCPGAPVRRPSSLRNMRKGRAERLEAFFRRIRPGRPSFYMKHMLLPHDPQQYLPSGRRTRAGARDLIPTMNGTSGFHDRFLTQHNHQRFLLQLGFVDRELGKLLRRLVRLDLFDKTLIVLLADHGKALSEVGVLDRRKVNERNVDEVAPVPLLIKAPGQRRGRVNRAYAQTLDVTPTIADVLGFRLGYRAHGRSAFSRRVRARRSVRLPTRVFFRIIRISARRYEARRRRNVRRALRLFGAGADGLFTGIGPNRGLLGRRAADVAQGPRSSVTGRIVAAGRLRRVRRASGILPTQIVGPLRGGPRGAKRDVAVAVNGRIEAVGRTWYLRRGRREHFAFNVPERSLREGRNRVEVFEVDRRGRLRLLVRWARR